MDVCICEAGLFGKVATHGDFVRRRLPDSFVAPWDNWLQNAMIVGRELLGSDWLPIYLNSPIWRFALGKGVCGSTAWVGVLMPSVDRVGRHFPLTITASVASPGVLFMAALHGARWYDMVETLILSALNERFSLDGMDNTLLTMAPFALGSVPLVDRVYTPLASLDAIGEALPALAHTIAPVALDGYTLWWSEGSPQVQLSLALHRGLPTPAAYTAMLSGNWQGQGWTVLG